MARLLLFLCFLVCQISAVASHIAGGNFEMRYDPQTDRYIINLILFFDVHRGHPMAKDPFIQARIFRKHDNAVMRDVNFNDFTEVDITGTHPECASDHFDISKLTYTTSISLPSEHYNHPAGYYIAWERCCRTWSDGTGHDRIVNIHSVNVELNPTTTLFAGQTFYLEFPPVNVNGEHLRNSAPTFKTPFADYACINKPYYADMSATDADGDELVYSLVTPLNSHDAGNSGFIGPRSAPYPLVTWQDGYSLNRIMNGSPDLSVNTDGLIRVTPGSETGLFVFAVKCEEFRDGRKIGETRREFQIFVTECPAATAPIVTGKRLNETFIHRGFMSINFGGDVSDTDRCFDINITDQDAQRQGSEKITIRAIDLQTKLEVPDILAEETFTLTSDSPSRVFRICLDECPLAPDGAFQLGFIAHDDACSLPLHDTLNVYVYVEPPANNLANFITKHLSETVNEGSQRIWNIEAIDADSDSLAISYISEDFDFHNSGFSITTTESSAGHIEAELTWNTDCSVFDFSSSLHYPLQLLVDDQDHCKFTQPDTLLFDLTILLPDNRAPEITTNLSPGEISRGITKKLLEPVALNVTATDPDNDLVHLELKGTNFQLANYNITFPGGLAPGTITSNFLWETDCNIDIDAMNHFEFLLIASDEQNKCHIRAADTVSFSVNLLPPDNSIPEVSIVSMIPEVIFENNTSKVSIGQPLKFHLKATDLHHVDSVTMDLYAINTTAKPDNMLFEKSDGIGSAEGFLSWTPDCSVFKSSFADQRFDLTFIATDKRCYSPKADTFDITIIVTDIDARHSLFLPGNIITPNSDGCNDFFAVEGFLETEIAGCGEFNLPNLPLDNCAGEFSSIQIYNRWGQEVFYSNDRKFRWYADDVPGGNYFYTIKFSQTEAASGDITYKGWVTVQF